MGVKQLRIKFLELVVQTWSLTTSFAKHKCFKQACHCSGFSAVNNRNLPTIFIVEAINSIFHNYLAPAFFKTIQKIFYLCQISFQPIITEYNGIVFL